MTKNNKLKELKQINKRTNTCIKTLREALYFDDGIFLMENIAWLIYAHQIKSSCQKKLRKFTP